MPVKLSFKDIIFVMEDVDAASPIVHARAPSDSKETTKVTLEKKGGGEAGAGPPEEVKLTREVSTVGGAEVTGVATDGGDAGLVMAMLSSLADSGGSGDKKGYVRPSLTPPAPDFARTTRPASTCLSTTSSTSRGC
jgi:hypothetical protein